MSSVGIIPQHHRHRHRAAARAGAGEPGAPLLLRRLNARHRKTRHDRPTLHRRAAGRDGVHHRARALPRTARHHAPGGAGRVRRPHRPLGLRQEHAAEPDRRTHPTHRRRAAVRQPRDRRTRPRAGGGVPEPLAAAVADLLRQRAPGGRAGVRRHRHPGAAQGPHAGRARAGGHGARGGQAPARDLRRHEAARGHRARAGRTAVPGKTLYPSQL